MRRDRNLADLPPERDAGFTLLEVLVAFVICALALGGFLQVFSTSLRGVERAEDTTVATLLAESKLATVGSLVPLGGDTRRGLFEDRFRWRIDSAPLAPDDDSAVRGPLRPYRVTVEVRWGTPSRPRSVVLTSLRLAKGD